MIWLKTSAAVLSGGVSSANRHLRSALRQCFTLFSSLVVSDPAVFEALLSFVNVARGCGFFLQFCLYTQRFSRVLVSG